MLVFCCDRCGKTFDKSADEEIEVRSSGEIGKVNRLYCSDRNAVGRSLRVDLCPKCVKSFQKWLNKHDEGKNAVRYA